VILADTSAWVEFDRATGSAVDRRMAELIASDGPLAVTEPVLMEVLAGAIGVPELVSEGGTRYVRTRLALGGGVLRTGAPPAPGTWQSRTSPTRPFRG